MMRIDGVRDVQPAAVEQPEGKTRPAGLDLQAVKSLFTSHGVGIPPEHALRMQAVAKEKDTVFGIRPVEGMVTTLIEEGYPTKGFSVKGKSANWGPQAGFICVDQLLSKRENRDAAEIDKLNQAVAKGMK
ncbi:anthrax toxin-like adenylyl cyclase domain-containing protein, partial [Aeromonas rivipollensis]